ncbi:hypothetical protein CS022_20460 [Veronia nyctiphanis]|uniref:Uncharacterized protein n=1 Tax=Veronia nyctiphanis TaxID=1278244 RepID=A0A4Q0YRI9_9GAMM|nr:hypothetical protein [Veronia nyctiphanis]RXJ71581.1 hypothetical protein CS022_20460 [Veronia nyctiphanis]
MLKNYLLPLLFAIPSLALATDVDDEEQPSSLHRDDASFLLARKTKNQETTCREIFAKNMLERQISFSDKQADVEVRRLAEIQIEEARKALNKTHSFCQANEILVMQHSLPRDTESGQIHFEGY